MLKGSLPVATKAPSGDSGDAKPGLTAFRSSGNTLRGGTKVTSDLRHRGCFLCFLTQSITQAYREHCNIMMCMVQ